MLHVAGWNARHAMRVALSAARTCRRMQPVASSSRFRHTPLRDAAIYSAQARQWQGRNRRQRQRSERTHASKARGEDRSRAGLQRRRQVPHSKYALPVSLVAPVASGGVVAVRRKARLRRMPSSSRRASRAAARPALFSDDVMHAVRRAMCSRPGYARRQREAALVLWHAFRNRPPE